MRVAIVFALVAIACKDEPAAPPPPKPEPPKLIPLAGPGFYEVDQTSCLAPTITQLRKQPRWMVRIDELSSFEDNIDAPPGREGVIEWEANGARYRHDYTPGGRTPLPAEQVTALEKALSLSCLEQPQKESFVRFVWYEIAFGLTGPAATSLTRTSDVVQALSPIFDAARANHMRTRLPLARTLVLTASGKEKLRDKHDYPIPKAWKPRTIRVDLRTPSKDISDDDAVFFLDYAMGLPETLPVGPQSLIGTLTVDGKSRPVAIPLDMRDRDSINMNRKPFDDIFKIGQANQYQYEYD